MATPNMTFTSYYDAKNQAVHFCNQAAQSAVIRMIKSQKGKSGLYSIVQVPDPNQKNEPNISSITQVPNAIGMIEIGKDAKYILSEDELVTLLAIFGQQPINGNRADFDKALQNEIAEITAKNGQLKYYLFPVEADLIDVTALRSDENKKILSAIKGFKKTWPENVTANSVILDVYIEPLRASHTNKAPQSIDRYALSQSLQDNWHLFEWAKNTLETNFIIKPLLIGSQGSGKTEFAKYLAKWLGWDFVRVMTPDMRTPTDWYYKTHVTVEKGASRTEYVNEPLSIALMEAMKTGKGLVVLLDEINRVADDNITNPILSFLDEDKRFLFGEIVNGKPVINAYNFIGKLIVVRAMNDGGQYTGASLTDSAQFGRAYPVIRMERPDKKLLEDILHNDFGKIIPKEFTDAVASVLDSTIEMTQEIRGAYEVGIRDCILICESMVMYIQTGNSLDKSFLQSVLTYGIANKYSNTKVRSDVIGIIESL